MSHKVVFAPEAEGDLLEIYDTAAHAAGAERAMAYVERIERYCRGLRDFPHRGRRRDDLRPGLRVIGFERRVAIAFYVSVETVVILRVLYGGRDLGQGVGELKD